MVRSYPFALFVALGFLAGCSAQDAEEPSTAQSGGRTGAGADRGSGGSGAVGHGAQGNGAQGSGAASGTGASAGSGNQGECKRGVAYGYHSKADFAAISPGISWWYNWHFRPDQELRDGSYRSAGVEYVPMVWGAGFDAEAILEDMPTDVTTLLGFNEPNFGEQANLSASAAAASWPGVEQLANERGLLLVSPAVNFCGGNCQETDPFKYLDDFFAACQGCRVDHVAFHIYVGCNQEGENKAQWLINHVETYKERFSQPLWLTEFACTNAANFDEQVAFLEDAVAYLEAEPRIHRYSWFSGRFQGIPYVDLYGGDGQLTPLGIAYRDAPAPSHCR